jgi:hypothetical protein
MRTTLSLDPDVAAMLKKAVAAGKKSFKDVVNGALRVGLAAIDQPAKPKKRFVQRSASYGPVPSPQEIKDTLLKEDMERFSASSRP